MSAPWLHAGDIALAPGLVPLEPEEARHARGALRLRDGDAVVLFDGRGEVAEGVLAERGAAVRVGHVRRVEPAVPHITVAACLPKGDRSAVMIDMATQLGVSVFIPLELERRVVEATPRLLDRLRRVTIEACKQSRRAHVPVILPPATLDDVLSGAERSILRLVGDPEGGCWAEFDCEDLEEVVVLIGPEGGLTAMESSRCAEDGVAPLRLNDGVLRIETAVACAVALVRGRR